MKHFFNILFNIFKPLQSFFLKKTIFTYLVLSLLLIPSCSTYNKKNSIAANVYHNFSLTNLNNWRKSGQTNLHKSEIVKICPLEQGSTYFLAIDNDGQIILHNSENSSNSIALGSIDKGFQALACSKKRLLLAAAYPRKMQIFRIPDGKLVAEQDSIKARTSALDFDSDGLNLLIGTVNGMIHRWRFTEKDLARRSNLERYIGHASIISDVKYHPNGRIFFSSDLNSVISAWLAYEKDQGKNKYNYNKLDTSQYADKATRQTKRGNSKNPPKLLTVTDSGEDLVVANNNGVLELWDIRGFVKKHSTSNNHGYVYSISSHKNIIASSGRDGYVKIWKINAETKEIELSNKHQIKGTKKINFLPNGTLIVGTTEGKIIYKKTV